MKLKMFRLYYKTKDLAYEDKIGLD